MRTLITNALVLDMVGDMPNIKPQEILINDNLIEKVEEKIDISKFSIDETINAKNMLVMPGLVNTHTHLAMSIFKEYKKDKKLMKWLEKAIFPVEEKLNAKELYISSYLSCIELIKSGTTTCNDMYFGLDKTIEAIQNTHIRAIASWCIKDEAINGKIEKTRDYALKFNNDKNSKIKIYVSADSINECSEKTLLICRDLAKELNTGMHIHLSETLSEEKSIQNKYGMSSIEYLNNLNMFDVPVVLAHGVYISDQDLEILKNIKGGIVHNPVSNFKTSSEVCDVEKIKKYGVNVGLGTDGIDNGLTSNMFEEMRVAGYLQNSINKKSKFNPYDILKMATIDGAKVLGLDKEIGSIEVGKKADIIFIKMDNFDEVPNDDFCLKVIYSLNSTDVDTVFIDGKKVMQNRKLIDIDENITK